MITTLIKREQIHTSVGTNTSIRIGSKHKGIHILRTSIVYMEAFENYTWIHLLDGSKVLSCKPIKHYEDIFKEYCFARIHRSYLVNLSHVKAYEKRYRLLHLKCRVILSVSYRKHGAFSKLMENHAIIEKL